MNGERQAVALIRVVRAEIKRFDEVGEQFAKEEGDGSLENWIAIHQPYYTQQLSTIHQIFSKEILLHCIWFEVVKKIL